MNAITYTQLALDWTPRSKTSRQFLLLASVIVILMMAAGIFMSFINVPEPDRQARVEVPDRIAKFILDKPKPKPTPVSKPVKKPEPVKTPEPKKEEKPKVKKKLKKEPKKALTDSQKEARKKAEKSGILALADQLEGLMDTTDISASLGGSIKSTSSSAKTSTGNSQNLLLADAAKGSGGVSEKVFTTRIAPSSELSKRDITQVRQSLLAEDTVAKVDPSQTTTKERDKTPRAGIRGEEEITIIFDQNKSKLFSIYNRARRKNPSLKGRIVLQITVVPSGKVSKIIIVSSELNDPKLERSLLSRIRQFNFGARNVEEITITYPVEFLPG